MEERKRRIGDKLGQWRHTWRQRSHQESHAQDTGGDEPAHAHPLASSSPPTLVSTAGQLAEMVDHLTAEGAFAFDSEFIGERSYEPLLCLVQAATSQRVFVVDPMGGLDLSALWEFIADDRVEKIVLAGQQDFAPAVARTNRPPANVMDVQIAAGFIHAEYPLSLGRLLSEYVGVSLGKAHTFTHWDNRPLSSMQIRYAADDVRYLPAARAAIAARLKELGRESWARQECAAVLEDLSLYRPDPAVLYQRVRGRDRLGRRQLAVLRELAIWRDQTARHENIPARTLLKDSVMTALARRPIATVADLDTIRGLPRPVEHAYGRQIVEAILRASALSQDDWPPTEPAERPAVGDRADKAWGEITRFCQDRWIAPSLVASRKEVARVFLAAEKGEPLEAFRLFRGWRKELLGSLLSDLLNG